MSVQAAAGTWTSRHLLDVDQLSPAALEACLDLARDLRERRSAGTLGERGTRLQGELVGLAFYEGSTRTRVSFELAARALGAQVIALEIGGSSVPKGESLADTLRTLERTGIGTVVLRHAASGAPYLAARSTGLRLVNAGDGTHAHPTQALADALTLRDAIGSLDGRRVAIVGDVAHSRVARSGIRAFTTLGAQVTVGGPPAWVAGFATWPGVRMAVTLRDALDGADAVMALRVQLERAAGGGVTSMAAYTADWGLTEERMAAWAAPGAVLMHPGPTNEGVELTAALAGGPRSLIGRQVENGVPVRMAVFSLLAD